MPTKTRGQRTEDGGRLRFPRRVSVSGEAWLKVEQIATEQNAVAEAVVRHEENIKRTEAQLGQMRATQQARVAELARVNARLIDAFQAAAFGRVIYPATPTRKQTGGES